MRTCAPRPSAGLIRIAAHLGVPCEPSDAQAALAFASFPNMLAVELRNGIRGYEYDRRDPEARRVRRGRIGGYRDYLDAGRRPPTSRRSAPSSSSPAARAVLERHGVAPWNQVS